MVDDTHKGFDVDSNNKDNKFLRLAYGCCYEMMLLFSEILRSISEKIVSHSVFSNQYYFIKIRQCH